MTKNELIQARGEIAYRIALEGLNIYKDKTNSYVIDYWKLTNMIESYK
ncbi:hypothetical protein [Clostridium paraputrificum]|nr:hypothetical protein [Clostridium paraputrificum]